MPPENLFIFIAIDAPRHLTRILTLKMFEMHPLKKCSTSDNQFTLKENAVT